MMVPTPHNFDDRSEKELRPVPSKAGAGNAYRSDLNQSEVARWRRLCDALLEAHAQLEMGSSLRPFVKWCDRVARYSFRAGHILSALGEDTASGPAEDVERKKIEP